MKTTIHGRAFVIDMPLDAWGNGPAEETDICLQTWEVWDDVCNCICRCNKREDAQGIADLLNTTAVWPRYMFRENS